MHNGFDLRMPTACLHQNIAFILRVIPFDQNTV